MPTNNPEDAKAILQDNPDALKVSPDTVAVIDNIEPLEKIADDKEVDKHAGGRPTIYGPEVVQKLVAAVQRGMSIGEACQYGGISTSTFYDWIKEYPVFSDKIERAKTYLFRMSKEVIATAITVEKDKNISKWYLEKRDPDFNPKTQLDLGGGIKVEQKDDKLLEYLEQMKELALNGHNSSGQSDQPDASQPSEEPS